MARPRLHTCLVLLLLASGASHAEQYRSQELVAPALSATEVKSIEELEKGLASMPGSYGKASTARYLARHFANGNPDKAEQYYRTALQGDGLSDFAKQDVLAELAQVYLRQKKYPQLLEALEQRRALGGKDTTVLLVTQALAYTQVQQYAQAVTSADAALAAEKNPDATMLQQMLFVYFNSKAYAKAAQVQQRYLQLRPDDLAGWRQLAAIYLKLEQKGKAADALSVAYRQQLPLSEQDLYLLVELYARNGNPYAAARLLEQAIAQKRLPDTVDYREKLFTYWMMARERTQAITALQQALQLQPGLDRYLQLAQLQMEQQQWQAMKDSVVAACGEAVPDIYVSHANLLLGISELKLGNRTEARRAFINATLAGDDEAATAHEYLRYMEAEPATEQELETFEGICLPGWARASAVSMAIPAIGEQKAAGKALAYNIKTTPAQTLVTGTFSLPVADMEKKLRPLAMQLATHVVKNGGRIAGNMHFIFPELVQPGAEVIRFQMAFPVSKQPQLLGRYRLLKEQGYKSASTVFQGPPEQLPAQWQKLYEAAIADGHKPSGSARQIVLEGESATRERIKLELQLGLE